MLIYLWATLLLIANSLAWLMTLFTLPGNWILIGFTAIYILLLPEDAEPHVSWLVVFVSLALAGLGELVEFLAGAAGAASQGGSRRGVVLAVVGAIAGSLIGAFVTIPIPVFGPIIGALGGGAAGAFLGAWVGETGSNRPSSERFAISRGAFTGRLLGTAGKLAIGAIMLVLITLDSFLDVSTFS